MVIVVMDASIKNHVTISIAHVHVYDCSVIKTVHHTVNIMSTKVELFAIRCGINQATCIPNIKRIVIITDFIHTTKRIFDSLVHPYQIHLVAILHELRDFFEQSSNNTIEFWDCSSHCEWSLHAIVNKELKKFNLTPIYPCKSLWDFSRNIECYNILNSWKIQFQASDDKEHHFLELLDDNLNPIEPSIAKGGLWLKYFRCYNLMLKVLSKELTLVLSDTRELDRVSTTK